MTASYCTNYFVSQWLCKETFIWIVQWWVCQCTEGLDSWVKLCSPFNIVLCTFNVSIRTWICFTQYTLPSQLCSRFCRLLGGAQLEQVYLVGWHEAFQNLNGFFYFFLWFTSWRAVIMSWSSKKNEGHNTLSLLFANGLKMLLSRDWVETICILTDFNGFYQILSFASCFPI